MKVKQIRTTKTKYWDEMPEFEFSDKFLMSDTSFVINTKNTYQTITGFGGAVTESAVTTILEAPKELQNEMLKSYYTAEGLNYNLGRVHIASSDFSLGNYEYLKTPDLESFDMSHEDEYLIPMLHKIDKLHGKKINYLASPWSPPAFMKSNKERNYGGILLKKYYPLYSEYLVKYLEEMEKRDINITSLSIQNEPAATQTWDSCLYSAEDERDFVKNNLGPLLEKKNNKIKVLVWDHNMGDILVKRAHTVFSDIEASKYIYGVAFHWYGNEDFDSLDRYKKLYPDKGLMFTEGCVEYSVYGKDNDWSKGGEHYARHIINDFNNYNECFIDWNIVLNEKGGPNHVGNYCESPIMYDRINSKIIKNSSFYYIGHFSRYLKEGAKRINSVKLSSNSKIHSSSFIQGNEVITVVLNEGWIENVTLVIDGKGKQISLPNNSISTFVTQIGGE